MKCKRQNKLLKYFNKPNVDVQVNRIKSLPEKKGYASSSADIFAAIFGLTKVLNKKTSTEDILKIALTVEPTDSTLWKHLTLQSYKDEFYIKQLGNVPLLSVLIFDFDIQVDTVSFNRIEHSSAKNITIEQAYNFFIESVESNNIKMIGKASTISALANQNKLHKPELNKIIIFAKSTDSIGVCVAHSGSLIGVLVKQNKVNFVVEKAIDTFGNSKTFETHKVIQSGPRFLH